MLTTYSSNVPVNTDAPEWTPPGWGTDEENAAEAAKFNTFTRNLRPVL